MATAHRKRGAVLRQLPAGLFSSPEDLSTVRTHFRQSRKNVVNLKKFFSELKRRNVYRVAAAYGVVSWLLVQITTQIFPVFEIPNWGARLVIVVLALGFPVALVLAWAYELTPEGLKPTEEVDLHKPFVRQKGRILDFIIIGV